MMEYKSSFIRKTNDLETPRASVLGFNVIPIHWSSESVSSDEIYQQLVFEILKHPKKLMTHLQRIYLAYQNEWSDRFYASIIDLLFWMVKVRI